MYEIFLKKSPGKQERSEIEAILNRLDPDAEVSFDFLDSRMRIQSTIPQEKIERELHNKGVEIQNH